MDHYLLFSADNQAGATKPVYQEFMESRYHEDFDRWRAERVLAAERAREATARMVQLNQEHEDNIDRNETWVFGTRLDKRL